MLLVKIVVFGYRLQLMKFWSIFTNGRRRTECCISHTGGRLTRTSVPGPSRSCCVALSVERWRCL